MSHHAARRRLHAGAQRHGDARAQVAPAAGQGHRQRRVSRQGNQNHNHPGDRGRVRKLLRKVVRWGRLGEVGRVGPAEVREKSAALQWGSGMGVSRRLMIDASLPPMFDLGQRSDHHNQDQIQHEIEVHAV